MYLIVTSWVRSRVRAKTMLRPELNWLLKWLWVSFTKLFGAYKRKAKYLYLSLDFWLGSSWEPVNWTYVTINEFNFHFSFSMLGINVLKINKIIVLITVMFFLSRIVSINILELANITISASKNSLNFY